MRKTVYMLVMTGLSASLVFFSGCGGTDNAADDSSGDSSGDSGQAEQVELIELADQCGSFTSTGLDAGTYSYFEATADGAIHPHNVSVHIAYALDEVDAREKHLLLMDWSENDTTHWAIELNAVDTLAEQVNDESSAGANADGWTDRLYVAYNADDEPCACEPGATNYGAIDCG